jgi:hypothetical protein
MIKAIATMPDIILYLLDSELKACHRVATISDREPIDRSGACTKRGEAWSNAAPRVNAAFAPIVRPPAAPAKPQIGQFPHLLFLDPRAAVAQSAGGLFIFWSLGSGGVGPA